MGGPESGFSDVGFGPREVPLELRLRRSAPGFSTLRTSPLTTTGTRRRRNDHTFAQRSTRRALDRVEQVEQPMPLLALGIVQPSTDERSRGGLASLSERLERGAIPSYVHTPNVRAALAPSTPRETSAVDLCHRPGQPSAAIDARRHERATAKEPFVKHL
jgi:hypothetical protein